jgi:hypothetical protein
MEKDSSPFFQCNDFTLAFLFEPFFFFKHNDFTLAFFSASLLSPYKAN